MKTVLAPAIPAPTIIMFAMRSRRTQVQNLVALAAQVLQGSFLKAQVHAARPGAANNELRKATRLVLCRKPDGV
jgi:hypothetical protein